MAKCSREVAEAAVQELLDALPPRSKWLVYRMRDDDFDILAVYDTKEAAEADVKCCNALPANIDEPKWRLREVLWLEW